MTAVQPVDPAYYLEERFAPRPRSARSLTLFYRLKPLIPRRAQIARAPRTRAPPAAPALERRAVPALADRGRARRRGGRLNCGSGCGAPPTSACRCSALAPRSQVRLRADPRRRGATRAGADRAAARDRGPARHGVGVVPRRRRLSRRARTCSIDLRGGWLRGRPPRPPPRRPAVREPRALRAPASGDPSLSARVGRRGLPLSGRAPARRLDAGARARSYDSSFHDTDPFDAQPGGCCSILPYFLGDLVELPITLPHDFTLFELLQRARHRRSGGRRLAGSPEHGGLVNVLVHPDYASTRGAAAPLRRAARLPRSLRRRLARAPARRRPLVAAARRARGRAAERGRRTRRWRRRAPRSGGPRSATARS